MMKFLRMMMADLTEEELKLRANCLKILLSKYGDIDPFKDKYSSKDIYECADEWISKGHKISAGITDYFHAYFSKHAGQESS